MMPANLKIKENVTVAKLKIAFMRYRHNLKMGGNLTITNSLQSPQNSNPKRMVPAPKESTGLILNSSKNVPLSPFSSIHDAVL